MAKGDPKNKGQAFRDSVRGNYKQAVFCKYSLTDEDKAACKAWNFDPEMLDTSLLRLVDEEYKITLRYDNYSNAYACWLLSPEKHEDNPNMILSGRGSSPLKAYKQALWQHTVLFDGIWPKQSDLTSASDIDD